jgi:PST family polysaccharide transporter
MLISNFFVGSFPEAIVQKQDVTAEHKAAVFWFSLTLGIALMIVSLLLAEAVAAVFGTPEVANFLCGLAVTYPMLGASAFCAEVLRRQMNFRWLALRTVLSSSAATVLAIFLVSRGYGVWSLVWYHVCWRVCELAILLLVTDWRPRSWFSFVRFREVAHYGFHAMGLRLLAYLSTHLDKVVVGLFLGPAPLGIYMMGHRMVRAITNALSGVLSSISLAIFSRLQGHKRVFGRAYSNATRLSNLVGLPIFVGLAIVAEPIVTAFLRPDWAPLVPILQILCVGGALSTVTYIQSAALRALGEVAKVFWIDLLLTIVRLCLLAIVVRSGLIAVAVTACIFSLLPLPFWQIFIARRLNSDVRSFFTSFLPATWCSIMMAASSWLASELLANHVSAAVRLAAIVVVGIVSYFACLVTTSPSSIALLRSFLRIRVPQVS